MYYIAKIAQAAGLTVMLISFLKNFPKLMNPKIFGIGARLLSHENYSQI